MYFKTFSFLQNNQTEVEKLKAALKAKDDMCNKLKAVAVKTKKELTEIKSKVNITEIENHFIHVYRFTVTFFIAFWVSFRISGSI